MEETPQGIGLLGSPYTLWESAQWLFRYLHPRMGRIDKIDRAPRSRPLGSTCTHRILFFGDLMAPPGAKAPNVEDSLRGLLSSADCVIGNLEAPIGTDRASANRFGLSQRTFSETIERLGVGETRCLLSIANNHIGDFGAEGTTRTIDALRGVGIIPLGVTDSPESPAHRLSLAGMMIDLVAWTQWLNHPIPDAPFDVARQQHAQRWIESPRTNRACLTIALPHWGHEFVHSPRRQERELAAAWSARGVDLIVGHHPHVIQPAETIGQALCVYSLGGLIQGRAAALRWPTRLGAILAVDVAFMPGAKPELGYRLIGVVHEHGRSRNRLMLLDQASRRDRDRMARRFDAVYPDLCAHRPHGNRPER